MTKRRLSLINEAVSKRVKTECTPPTPFQPLTQSYVVTDEWESPSRTRNFLLGDPFADWAEKWWGRFSKGKTTSPTRRTSTPSLRNSSSFLLTQGNNFENMIINEISKKFDIKEFRNVGSNHFSAKNIDEALYTEGLFRAKVPIIHGGVVHDVENKIHGVFDLAIREDYISKVFTNIPEYILKRLKIAHDSKRYFIVEIKFSTIPLKSDGYHILNTSSFPAYKGQLYLYNRAISKLTGVENNISLILGRGYKLVQGGSTTLSQDPFERFGVVDFGGNDVDVVSKTNAAVSWLRDVKKDGWSWNPYKPQRDEMFPNMCVSSDISSNVKEAKEAVSQRIGEISQVWMCGVAARKHAHSQGVKSWKDDRCTSQILGFRDGKISKTLDAILNFNRRCLSLPKKSTVEQKIYVDRETISSDVVVTTPCANEFFIDFEMAGDIGVSRNAKPIIFMIGVSHNLTTPNGCSIKKSKRNKRSGKHTSVVFSTSEMEWKNESDVCEKFVKYISTHSVVNKPIRVFHWSSTERWRWDKFCKIATPRLQRVIARSQIEFVDMYEIFKRNNIVIEGCLDYKLKNIAKKMWELGLIETTWPKEGVTDGFGATVELQNALDGGDIVKINNVIESIETYNKVDVNVLREMMNCIRRL
jgi:hypothetical protein